VDDKQATRWALAVRRGPAESASTGGRAGAWIDDDLRIDHLSRAVYDDQAGVGKRACIARSGRASVDVVAFVAVVMNIITGIKGRAVQEYRDERQIVVGFPFHRTAGLHVDSRVADDGLFVSD